MALAMAAVGFAFEPKGLQGWVRWIFFAQLLIAVGQIGWTMFDLNTNVFIATSMLWVIGAPAAFILIAVLFAKKRLQPVLD